MSDDILREVMAELAGKCYSTCQSVKPTWEQCSNECQSVWIEYVEAGMIPANWLPPSDPGYIPWVSVPKAPPTRPKPTMSWAKKLLT